METKADSALISDLRAAKLPTMPGVAVQLLQLGRTQNATIKDLVSLVESDPAIATMLVKLANSPAYARKVRSDSLMAAVRCLGYNNARSVALAATVIPALQRSNPPTFPRTEYWRRSTIAAVCARAIGQRWFAQEAEALFLAALIQDVGMLALAEARPALYDLLNDGAFTHDRAIVHERKNVWVDHAEIGAWLLEEWSFPEHIVRAVRMSNNMALWRVYRPQERSEPDFAAGVVSAGLLADLWMLKEIVELEQRKNDICRLLGLTWSSVVHLLSDASEEIPLVESLCQVQIPDAPQLQLTLSILRNTVSDDD